MLRDQGQIEKLFQELEEKGEKSVRRDLAQGVYNEKASSVRQWLAEKEAQRLRAKEAQIEEQFAAQTKAAQSSRNAAWVAAITAVVSALVAIAALAAQVLAK